MVVSSLSLDTNTAYESNVDWRDEEENRNPKQEQGKTYTLTSYNSVYLNKILLILIDCNKNLPK